MCVEPRETVRFWQRKQGKLQERRPGGLLWGQGVELGPIS